MVCCERLWQHILSPVSPLSVFPVTYVHRRSSHFAVMSRYLLSLVSESRFLRCFSWRHNARSIYSVASTSRSSTVINSHSRRSAHSPGTAEDSSILHHTLDRLYDRELWPTSRRGYSGRRTQRRIYSDQ
nr:hypothetical protein CFP56_77369 [Quercus suber]